MKKVRGFTLVELMVTIAVAGILVTVALPAFNNILSGWRLTNVTNEIVAAVHLARSDAVRLNRNVSLCRAASAVAAACAGGAANDLWQHWIVSNGNIARRASPDNVRAIRITSTLAGNQVAYGPGGLPNNTGTITVCSTAMNDQNRRVITVGPGNRVSVDRQTGNC